MKSLLAFRSATKAAASKVAKATIADKDYWKQYFAAVDEAFGRKVAIRDTVKEIIKAARYALARSA